MPGLMIVAGILLGSPVLAADPEARIPVQTDDGRFVVTYSNALPPERHLEVACLEGACRDRPARRLAFEDHILSVFQLSDRWPGFCVYAARGSAYSLTCLDLRPGNREVVSVAFKSLTSIGPESAVVDPGDGSDKVVDLFRD